MSNEEQFKNITLQLRCRRCRLFLICKNDDDENLCCETFSSNLESIFVDDDDGDYENKNGGDYSNHRTPRWIISALEEKEWLKGKFYCPGCKSKIGSFNFITPGKCACGRRRCPPAYFYKSKIVEEQRNFLPPKNASSSISNSNSNSNSNCANSSDSSVNAAAAAASSSNNATTNSNSNIGGKRRSHRKSQSWHASSFATDVSATTTKSWLASTLAEVSTHLDVAGAVAAETTKHVLAGTLNLGSVVAAPVSSALRRGHRKTRSWSGSIKTTLSSLFGGFLTFPDSSTTADNRNAAEDSTNHRGDDNDDDSRVISGLTMISDRSGGLVTNRRIWWPGGNDRLQLLVGNGTTGQAMRIPSDEEEEIMPDVAADDVTSIPPPPPPDPNPPLMDRSKSASTSSLIPEYLLCSICLDLFCLPRYCVPCRHVFCEPCLKLLNHNRNRHSSDPPAGSRSLVGTLCPLCRRVIRWTEPAKELTDVLEETASEFAARYEKRILDYRREDEAGIMVLPGFYRLKLIWSLIGWILPDGIGRNSLLEALWWMDYTPLVTLYSACVSVLCLLFFFALFLPGLYFTSCIWKIVDKFFSSIFNPNLEDGDQQFQQEAAETAATTVASLTIIIANRTFRETIELGTLILGSGVVSVLGVLVAVAVSLYTLFVM